MDLLFTHPIAQRSLVDLHGDVVDVILGAPLLFDGIDGDMGWYCPFRVETIEGRPWVTYGAGVGGVQALILALHRIGEYLSSLADLVLSFDDSRDLRFLGAAILRVHGCGAEQ